MPAYHRHLHTLTGDDEVRTSIENSAIPHMHVLVIKGKAHITNMVSSFGDHNHTVTNRETGVPVGQTGPDQQPS